MVRDKLIEACVVNFLLAVIHRETSIKVANLALVIDTWLRVDIIVASHIH